MAPSLYSIGLTIVSSIMPGQKRKQSPTPDGTDAIYEEPVNSVSCPNAGVTQNKNFNVRDTFNLCISGYEEADDHTGSDATRKPRKYDKHLDSCLRPTKLAYSPDLAAKLAGVANDYYQKYIEKLGSPPECNATNFSVNSTALHGCGSCLVRAEQGILVDYANRLPPRLLPIVSALAFETPSWKTRYLNWTTEQRQDEAIADAALRIELNIPAQSDVSHACPYGIPEAKKSGKKKISQMMCNNAHNLNCHICDNPFAEELKNVACYFPNILAYEFKNLRSGSIEFLCAILEQTSLSRRDGFDWQECDKDCKHQRISSEIPTSGSPTGFDAENPIIQITTSDWTKDQLSRHQPPVVLMRKHRTSAKLIVQQIWSEMVRNDTTFLVLNSGNLELIAFRNRAERILYLSDIIATQSHKPSEHGYFQTHVGLYIASIRDAVDRAAQLKACDEANSLPSSWTAYAENRRIQPLNVKPKVPGIQQVLSECQQLCLVPTNNRVTPPYRSRNLYERHPREGCYRELKIWTKDTNDDNICIGTVEISGQTFEDRIIIKTARGRDATQLLSKEFSVYISLGGNPHKCKIPVVYGFFVDSSNADVPYAILLLQHVGEPLSSKPTMHQLNSLRETMIYMRERCFEYATDLCRRSVVSADNNELFLVGLSNVRGVQSESKSHAEEPLRSRRKNDSDLELTGKFALLVRDFKRPRNRGPSIHLGPVPTARPARQAFEEITRWMKSTAEGVALLPTVRCIGWADDLPDWLEIATSSERVADFQPVWAGRPDHLRRVICNEYL